MRAPGVLLPLALVVSLAGCAADEEPAGDEQAPSSAAPPAATSPPASTGPGVPSASDPIVGEETAPGSRLQLGDVATVGLLTYAGEPTGTAEVTVTSIEQLPAEEFDGAGGQPPGDALWLVSASLTITEVGDGLGSVYPTVDLTGDAAGSPLPKPGIELSEAADCVQTGLDREAEVGDTVDFCVGAVTRGDQVVSAAWSPSRSDYSYRDGSPIVWVP